MLLSAADIDYRLALYTELREAMDAIEAMEAALPLEVPDQFGVEWEMSPVTSMFYGNAMNAVTAVCVARWASLREAALTGVRAKLAAAERAVAKFESGEEV